MKRERYIDILKILASFSIIVLHVNSNSLHQVQNFLPTLQCDVSFYVHQLLYLAVPVFVILTGAGLLAGKRGGYEVVWPQIRKMLFCIIAFGSLFEMANVLVRHETFSVAGFLEDIWNGTSWSHMWYLNKILGVYLVFPILSYFVEKASRRDIFIADIVLYSFTSFIPFLAGILNLRITSIIPIDGVFIPYVLAGYLIATEAYEKCRKYLPINIILMIGGMAGITGLCIYYDHMIVLENNPLAVLVSVNAVLIARAIISPGIGKFAEEISRCTLGIYIIHPIFLHIIISVLNINPQLKWPILSILLMATVIFIASFFTVWVLRKIGFIRKYLL